jgi:hypothetical protein
MIIRVPAPIGTFSGGSAAGIRPSASAENSRRVRKPPQRGPFGFSTILETPAAPTAIAHTATAVVTRESQPTGRHAASASSLVNASIAPAPSGPSLATNPISVFSPATGGRSRAASPGVASASRQRSSSR